GLASGATRTYDTFSGSTGEITINASHVGMTMCRSVSWDPTSWNDTNTASSRSSLRCVVVPHNFDLRPNITNPPESISPGQPIGPIEPRVLNEVPGGGTTVTPNNI